MAYGFEEKTLETQPHKLVLDGRGSLSLTGVSDVESFDEAAVVLHTVRGTLVVRGEGLHLQMLSLENGQVSISGTVDSLVYENDAAESGGFFSRLFR